jgi:NADP-dependent alcohol dehydrogenase
VKFISGAVNYNGDQSRFCKILIKENALPFGTVLTLPATGSEMNSGAVVTIKLQRKTDIRWFFVSKILYM